MNSEPTNSRALGPLVPRKAGGKIAGRERSGDAPGRSRIEQFKSKSVVGDSGKNWLRGSR